MKVKDLGPIESLVYVVACICTLGGLWLTRIVISKAIAEAVQGD